MFYRCLINIFGRPPKIEIDFCAEIFWPEFHFILLFLGWPPDNRNLNSGPKKFRPQNLKNIEISAPKF